MIDCMDRHDKDMAVYGTKDRQFGRGDFYQVELEKSAIYKRSRVNISVTVSRWKYLIKNWKQQASLMWCSWLQV